MYLATINMTEDSMRSSEKTALLFSCFHITAEGYIYTEEAILRILLWAYNLAVLNTMNQTN